MNLTGGWHPQRGPPPRATVAASGDFCGKVKLFSLGQGLCHRVLQACPSVWDMRVYSSSRRRFRSWPSLFDAPNPDHYTIWTGMERGGNGGRGMQFDAVGAEPGGTRGELEQDRRKPTGPVRGSRCPPGNGCRLVPSSCPTDTYSLSLDGIRI